MINEASTLDCDRVIATRLRHLDLQWLHTTPVRKFLSNRVDGGLLRVWLWSGAINNCP